MINTVWCNRMGTVFAEISSWEALTWNIGMENVFEAKNMRNKYFECTVYRYSYMNGMPVFLYVRYTGIPVWTVYQYSCMNGIPVFLYERYAGIPVRTVYRYSCMNGISVFLYVRYTGIPVWTVYRYSCIDGIPVFLYVRYTTEIFGCNASWQLLNKNWEP